MHRSGRTKEDLYDLASFGGCLGLEILVEFEIRMWSLELP